MMGLPVVLPWSCQVQLGVNTRSPGSMGILSPSTVVWPPSLSMMNRRAAGVCRWARADSPGMTICRPENRLLVVAIRPSKPGFSSINTRRSASSVPTSSAARMAWGRSSFQRHR